MKKKRPGLQDIADRVGITKMTVSRYLRDPAQVSKKLQAKIAQALDEQGYIPNRAPQLLSNAKSKSIGVLLPSLTNQVFSEVLRGIESITDKHGYQTMLAHYGYSAEREEMRLTSLLSYNIDGLILAERNHSLRTHKMLEIAGIPIVEIMDSVSPCIDLAVGFDNFEAARQMTLAIIAHGHQHTVYLAARLDERTLIKQQGYEQAMRESGLEPHTISTEQASSYSMGANLLSQALTEYPATDSLFCTNDDLAVGAVFECQRRGLRIPEDIAIAGFHGHNIVQSMQPKLATVITPRKEMGQIAAEQLMARLRGENVNPKMTDLGFIISAGESL